MSLKCGLANAFYLVIFNFSVFPISIDNLGRTIWANCFIWKHFLSLFLGCDALKGRLQSEIVRTRDVGELLLPLLRGA